MKVLYSLFLLLSIGQEVTHANNDVVRKLRSIPEAPQLISDAILSSVHSTNGEVDPEVMEKATNAGLPEDAVRKYASDAYKKMSAGNVTVEKIEEDMKTLVATAQNATKEEEEEKKTNNVTETTNKTETPKTYSPKRQWAMSYEAQRKLSVAVMNGFRNPTEEIDPKVLQDALDEGVALETIMKSLESMNENRRRIRRRTL